MIGEKEVREADLKTDTSDIEERLAQLDAPKKSDIWEKQAAMYRQQGEGAVLRTQRNLTNLFGPTFKVIALKEMQAVAKFNVLKLAMPEFDDSKIFGELGNSEIDIATEAKNISKTVKEDMRKISRMNVNHPDYDELRKNGPKEFTSQGGWFGITDKFWLTTIIPEPSSNVKARYQYYKKNNKEKYQVDYIGSKIEVSPGQTTTITNKLFAGAKEVKLLDKYEKQYNISRFDLAIDFGWYYFLTKPFLYVLIFFKN